MTTQFKLETVAREITEAVVNADKAFTVILNNLGINKHITPTKIGELKELVSKPIRDTPTGRKLFEYLGILVNPTYADNDVVKEHLALLAQGKFTLTPAYGVKLVREAAKKAAKPKPTPAGASATHIKLIVAGIEYVIPVARIQAVQAALAALQAGQDLVIAAALAPPAPPPKRAKRRAAVPATV